MKLIDDGSIVRYLTAWRIDIVIIIEAMMAPVFDEETSIIVDDDDVLMKSVTLIFEVTEGVDIPMTIDNPIVDGNIGIGIRDIGEKRLTRYYSMAYSIDVVGIDILTVFDDRGKT